ncbi:MAG: hypothetical protein KGD64_08210 [Candidatus Heimdallarchaeota archaeon]|nr:hypothetical protein [Candidatus Heimdallarchaeota archaeon]
MKTVELKLLAGAIVVESKLDKKSKGQLLEWIQNEASKIDTMGFLLDGRVRHFKGDSEQIVIDRFEISEAGGRIAKLRKSYSSQAGAGAGLNPVWLIYRKIRSVFDACTKGCGKYEVNTSRRQHCMIKCKLAKAQKELDAAHKSGDVKEVSKKTAALNKAKALAAKSSKSFSNRGADE